jgi:hypothetical protein
MSCVVSSSFTVLINGEASSFFSSERGLRQGCPLSPLIFILVMESISLLLKKGQAEGKLTGVKVSRIIKVLHLIFVDDVLIMSKASLEEWQVIKTLLETFCCASGLKISPQKSTFHFNGIQEDSLELFRRLFSFNFEDLSVGFCYLGYHLKFEKSSFEDWRWILIKFEKRINQWCNRWLTLGGQYILAKSVLETQSVYWMALAAVPVSVLSKIRKLIFDFLWEGGGKTQRIHLCSWETLAKPKHLGGWGLQNLFLFNHALAANSLWHVLFKEGIWKKVIKDKYLPFYSVATWLRSTSPLQPVASQIWKNLMRFLPIITRWISWKPGNGTSILIGLDKIMGIDNSSLLSLELRGVLKACNITFLYQASAQASLGFIANQWKTNKELELTGNLAVEWLSYCKALILSGIQLQPIDDLLIWTGGDHSRVLTVRNVYNALAQEYWPITVTGWRRNFGLGILHSKSNCLCG